MRTLTYGWFMALCVLGCSDDECGADLVRMGAMCVAPMADGGIESCNGLDDDMDGRVDETDPSAGSQCGTDVGVCTIGVLACIEGSLACNGESGLDETCNAIDDDCDGKVDESFLTTFYLDADLDGWGSEEDTCEVCEVSLCPGAGPWVAVAGDCDDTCESCFAGAVEACDMVDNDCDGGIDEGEQATVYEDGDRDGFGAGESLLTCLDGDGSPPPGYALRHGDCADDDARANPDATMMFSTRVRGVADEALDFDFNCDGREERLHEPCLSCRNGACWQGGVDPLRAADPPCGTVGRAQRSDLLEPPGRPPLCVQGEAYEDRMVACR